MFSTALVYAYLIAQLLAAPPADRATAGTPTDRFNFSSLLRAAPRGGAAFPGEESVESGAGDVTHRIESDLDVRPQAESRERAHDSIRVSTEAQMRLEDGTSRTPAPVTRPAK